MKKLSYSHMLPGVNYKHLSNDDLDDELLDLEYETQVILRDLSEGIKDIMMKAKMYTVLENMVAHLGAYLGFISVAALGNKRAVELKDKITELITKEAKSSYKIFKQFPITPDVENNEIRHNNLEKLREKAPGSIIVQTLRLGRVIFDVIGELRINRSYTKLNKEQSEFAPTMPFMVLLKTKCKSVLKELEKYHEEYEEAKLYHINHTAVQIGWLIGYFSDMSGENRVELFLQYTRGTTAAYIECGEKFLKIPINRMKNMAEMSWKE